LRKKADVWKDVLNSLYVPVKLGKWIDKEGRIVTAEFIKQKAKELGATICGIGNVELLRDEDARRNPFCILPGAKSIIGFGIKIPRGLYNAMDRNSQYYNYTNLGVKYIDETFAEIFLLKMGALIEEVSDALISFP
jgi:epoxyqueuosine reductase QueG